MAAGEGPQLIRLATSVSDLATVAALFEEYAASLPVDLDYQDFARELAELPGKYAPPDGALLLADSLGCVGLRPLSHGICEMKRLYIRPEARGTGLGGALADAVVAEARRLGYLELRLDTLSSMQRAIGMYLQMGFRPIDPYYGPTPPGTVFLSLQLGS